MSRPLRSLPRRLLTGDPRHGVVRHARELDAALREVADPEGALAPDDGSGPAHLHFTDRLFGASADEAAEQVVALARRRPLTVTLHDLPQRSDGRHASARRACYAAVARSARGVALSSRHELDLLGSCLGGVPVTATVIPLPLVEPVAPLRDVGTSPVVTDRVEATVLGFFYPGKGHADVVDALATLATPGLASPPRLTVLGAASDGHEGELADLVTSAGRRGVEVAVSGYLSDDALRRRTATAAVPVVAHQHVSASGSLNSWVAAGRRPLVRVGRYTEEMARLRPGTVTSYPAASLADAVLAGHGDPVSTYLGPDAVLRPLLDDVARAYVAWWTTEVSW